MNILAVGAYERDNFGDLLFLYMLRKILGDRANIIPSSIIFADMRAVNSEVILPYDFLLKKYQFDGIITVGGEVGGVDIVGALMMDISKNQAERIIQNNQDLNRIVEFYTGILQDSEKHAYIIDRTKYELNQHTPHILNSVGLSNIANLKGDFFENTKKILSNSIISVREDKSQDFLKANNIDSEISPDIVHAINLFRKKQKSSEKYIVFQINNELIKNNQYNYAQIAEKLAAISSVTKFDIKLFLAGVAESHDNVNDYQQICQEFEKLNQTQKISIVNNRNPLELVDCISASQMWIGTSLHGRIISAAYDVPRISLTNKKVSNYAQKWDEKMPYDVKIEDLSSDICAEALNSRVKIGEKLANKAMKNFEKVFRKAKIKAKSDSKIDETSVFFEYIKYAQEEFMQVIENKNQFIQEISKDKDILSDENIYYQETIKQIKDSKIYKLGDMVSKIKSAPKN
ncbi:MAG: polysaccharide pyruvyl transferase family protein [bacterium]|nr:polysaccharide pyruvyl transferase family protein [bacterium]